jgi:hypothetical protein
MTITSDLLTCLISIAVISAGLFVVGLRIGSRRGHRAIALAACVAALTLVAYAIWLSDNPVLTHILPLANVLLWGNLQLPAAALLGGVAWTSLRSPLWQRILLVSVLIAMGLWRESAPLLGRPPTIGPERWANGICRQTSTSSCSAAAAATLLSLHGIKTTEAEMIDCCLTHVQGTTTLGLYRGLKLKTAGTMWNVWADTPNADSLDRWPLPAVITVSLPGLGTGLLGTGVGHSIVVLRIDENGKFEIADPFAGRQFWTRQQLIDAYGGDLMALVPRGRNARH